MTGDFLNSAEFFSLKKMDCEEFASYIALAMSGNVFGWGMAAKMLEKRNFKEALILSVFYRSHYLSALKNLHKKGDRQATRALVGFYEFGCPGFPAEPKKAVNLLKKLASKGDAEAQFELFEKYLYGLCDLRQDKRVARRWLEKSAERGHLEALEWMSRTKEWESTGFVYPKAVYRD